MVRDGFYKVDFGAALPGAGGVVVVEGGNVRGGDDQYLYSGTVGAAGTSLQANIRVSAYVQSAVSVFNTQGGTFNLALSGNELQNGFVLAGAAPVPGSPPIQIQGVRIADLAL